MAKNSYKFTTKNSTQIIRPEFVDTLLMSIFLMMSVIIMFGSITLQGAITPIFPNQEEKSIVFCIYSKAEAVDLAGTIKSLHGRASILAFGTAKEHLKTEFANCMIDVPGTELIGTSECPAEKSLDPELIKKIAAVIEKYEIFVTGYGSEAQIDILQKVYEKRLTTCIGYYDPFQSMRQHRYAAKLCSTASGNVDALMVTCQSLQKECQELFPDLLIEKVGKQDLDVWSSYKEKDAAAIADAGLIWNPEALTILYAGCHGLNYEEDFMLFLKSVKEIAHQPISIWIALHPDIKCDGELERQAIYKMGLDNVTIAKKGIPTLKLLPFANVFVSATSGVVINAAAYGTPSFYVCEKYSNFFIEKGIAKKGANVPECKELFESSLTAKGSKQIPSDEIPPNASLNITHFIEGIIEVKKVKVS